MANNKLQNVKAVKELLAGVHKTQTNKTHGFTGKSDKKRAIGEQWSELSATGTEMHWVQKDGFRIKTAANSIITKVNKLIHMPDNCPTCNSNMYNNEEALNKKFWKINKTCFGCVIELETTLRAEGKYKAYEREKLHENAKSFFKDADKEVEILKKAVEGKLEFVQNGQGEVEEFDQSDYKEKYLNYIDTQYDRFKQETLTELKNKEK